MNPLRLVCLVSLGFILGSSPAYGQGTTFRWKLTPGLKLRAEIVQDIEQGVAGVTTPVTQNAKITQLWEVMSVGPDQIAKVQTTLEQTNLVMKIPGAGVVELDTSKPVEEETGFAAQLGKMFRPLIGVACENDMAPNGRISNVVIPESAMEGFRNIPLGSSMESIIKDSIENGSPAFPEEAIQPKHSWTHSHSTKTPVGELESANRFTYIGPSKVDGRTLHQFQVQLTMKFIGSGQTKVTISDQKAEGSLWFDNDRGYLVSSELDQSMTMAIEVEKQAPNQSVMKQKMKLTFTPVSSKKP